MTLPQSLTREEAQRQIAELQRHIASLPTNNHPPKIEPGMLFRHPRQGLFIAVVDSSRNAGWDLRNIDGVPWRNGKGFDGDENEFEYLGHAKDLLILKTDKPEVVVTDEMVKKAWKEYDDCPGTEDESMKHILTLALNGKL